VGRASTIQLLDNHMQLSRELVLDAKPSAPPQGPKGPPGPQVKPSGAARDEIAAVCCPKLPVTSRWCLT
jgi:hypothetical protein